MTIFDLATYAVNSPGEEIPSLTWLPVFHTRRHRHWLPRPTRGAKLPWLRCGHCGRRLFQIEIRDGWTAVRVGRQNRAGSYHDPVKIACRACKTVRVFTPRQV